MHDRVVFALLLTFIATTRSTLRTRTGLALEILALRQQLAVLQRRRPRPPLSWKDRLFWLAISRAWSGWRDVLILVKPENGRGLAPLRFPQVLGVALPETGWSPSD